MIKCLEEKGFTYKTSDGIYYDTSKFNDYGKMAMLDIEGLEEGKRVVQNEEKKNKTDFALWKFSPKDKQRQMEWDSPWGKGFPGWHLECSAMSIKFLGNNFDIHCGGVDHIQIHHTNEIAQSEACTGEKFVNYWLHGEFLIEDKGKMSKSAGETLTLQVLIDKGYLPQEYRYFLLMTHYRKKIKFSFENLDSARNGYRNLVSKIKEIKAGAAARHISSDNTKKYENKFRNSVNDDLNVTEGLAVCWDVLKDNELASTDKVYLLNSFDKVLGLGLEAIEPDSGEEAIPEEIKLLAEKRISAKAEKRFSDADKIREEITTKGYKIKDEAGGKYSISKIP
jgi:cysteinyl-tRNA synthetase